jgi:hypothetical protein
MRIRDRLQLRNRTKIGCDNEKKEEEYLRVEIGSTKVGRGSYQREIGPGTPFRGAATKIPQVSPVWLPPVFTSHRPMSMRLFPTFEVSPSASAV